MNATTIIRTQAEIADAPTSVLLATYNELTGESVARFSTRVVAERRCAMAILAAQDRTGHAGVKPSKGPIVPKTLAELEAEHPGDFRNPAAATQEQAATTTLGELEEKHPEDSKNPAATNFDDDVNPFQPGTMAHQLWVATRSIAKPDRKAKVERAPSAPKTKLLAVRATFAGTSKPQSGSQRTEVLLHVQDKKLYPDNTATVEQIERALGYPVRGHLQKLLEKNHLTALESAQ